jgi:hypothetical protein
VRWCTTRGRSPSWRWTTTTASSCCGSTGTPSGAPPAGGRPPRAPAGLRDEDGEPPLETAKRELAEEALLAAARWSLLVTVNNSPGFSDELVQIYLAEDLSPVDRPEGFLVEHEEADMTLERVPLADAVQRVFDGDIRNSSAVAGLLAAARVRTDAPRLRPVDAV